MQKKKGISLIVLVIVIIVMVILATAIIITISNTGIITRGEQAVNDTNKATIEESAQVIKVQALMTNTRLTQAELITELNSKFEGSTVNGNVVTTKDGKYDITVDENLKITVSRNQASNVPTTPEEPVIPTTPADPLPDATEAPGSYEDEWYKYTLKTDSTTSEKYYRVFVKDKTLTEYGNMYGVIAGVTVTDLNMTFDGCTNLIVAPVLPDSITNMEKAFNGCTNLTTVANIPTSVVSLANAFNNCTNLTTVPDIESQNLTDLSYAFRYCTSLAVTPRLPDSVTNMRVAFGSCTNLTTVTNIPNSVTSLSTTFSGCTNLTTVPDIESQNLTDLSFAFSNCKSLAVTPRLPDSVTNMEQAFFGCTNLTTVTNIPNSVTDLGFAFSACIKLSGLITINTTALTDGSYTFSSKAGAEGSGLTVVVPNDTVRQLLIKNSSYDSTKVSIVSSLPTT